MTWIKLNSYKIHYNMWTFNKLKRVKINKIINKKNKTNILNIINKLKTFKNKLLHFVCLKLIPN